MVSLGISRFVAQCRLSDLPADVVRVAKELLLDTLGAMVGGRRTPAGEAAIRYVAATGGSGCSCVVGSSITTSAPQAAFANGVMAHALDFDDISWSTHGHISPAVWPAVLASGEVARASGARLIEAFVVGFEAEAKIGRPITPFHFDQGWHATATLGSVGAAMGAAKVLGLGVDETNMSLGLAASQASGLRANFDGMAKAFHLGFAARNGVTAALLAQGGVTACPEVVEGRYGLWEVFGNGSVTARAAEVITGLGRPFDLVAPGVGVKEFPCCGASHAAVEALLGLIQEHRIGVDRVDRIECTVTERTREILIYEEPDNEYTAKYSLQYILAVALVDGSLGIPQFRAERVQDPRVRTTMRRIELRAEPASGYGHGNAFGATVTLHLVDGHAVRRRVECARGTPDLPLTPPELLQKFHHCVDGHLAPDSAKRLVEMVAELEQIADARELALLLQT